MNTKKRGIDALRLARRTKTFWDDVTATLSQCKLVMPVRAKAMEMGMLLTNNRKRMRKRMRQFARRWDPYAE